MIRTGQQHSTQTLVGERLHPGGFYRCVQPGGFTDAGTSIHVPGPKVRVDPDTRVTLEVIELPTPIQLPHFKIAKIFDREKREIIDREVPFTRRDEDFVQAGLQAALDAGVIERVAESHVEHVYPDAWAARKEHIVFDPLAVVRGAKSVRELLDDAEEARATPQALEAARDGILERQASAQTRTRLAR
jgi:hypothetical protein